MCEGSGECVWCEAEAPGLMSGSESAEIRGTTTANDLD